jgi:hypothetical protein
MDDTKQAPLTVGNIRFAPGKLSDAKSVGKTLSLPAREADLLPPHKLYEGILKVQDESTRRMLLLQFGKEYFPELVKILTGE